MFAVVVVVFPFIVPNVLVCTTPPHVQLIAGMRDEDTPSTIVTCAAYWKLYTAFTCDTGTNRSVVAIEAF